METYTKRSGLSDWLRRLNDTAADNGFDIIEFDGHATGHVTLLDRYGNEITIRSPHGLDIPIYVAAIKAITR